jgi:hypothetical protein
MLYSLQKNVTARDSLLALFRETNMYTCLQFVDNKYKKEFYNNKWELTTLYEIRMYFALCILTTGEKAQSQKELVKQKCDGNFSFCKKCNLCQVSACPRK